MSQIGKTLYKRTKLGAIQQWTVRVEENIVGSTIYVQQGQVGGAIQEYPTNIQEGKNIGKANETTPYQQALAEAISKWNKQVKKGYVEDPSGEVTVRLPMKVQTFQGKENNVVYPCSGSPKLDGVNGTYRRDAERVLTLWSRGGEEYPVIKQHIVEIHNLMDAFGCNELAGEVYCHGMHLQDITAGVKKYNAEFTPQLQFHVFDFPESTDQYKHREVALRSMMSNCYNFNKAVFIVPTIRIENEAEAWDYHKYCVDNKFEGIMLYNDCGLYEHNTRSSNVFKLKVQLQAEYKTVDFKIDKLGHPVFQCESKGGLFWVKPEGSNTRRKGILLDIDNWISKWLSVNYEKLSKSGKPTKPVGVCLRNCDDLGNPLE